MSYSAKTNWQTNEIVMPTDMNRIEQGIKDLDNTALFKVATLVYAGENLNNCNQVGLYTWSSANSSNISNCPEIGASATMWVLPRLFSSGDGNLTQLVITQTNKIYIRQLADNVWGNWADGPENFLAIKKYNVPAVTRTAQSSEILNTNPVPTSWTLVTGTISYQNNGYVINASAQTSGNQTYLAFDGSADTYWAFAGQTASWISLELPEPLLVRKFKLRLEATGNGASGFIIRGSNNNNDWVDLYTNTGTNMPNTLTEIILSNPGTYKYYRIFFPVDGTTSLKNFRVYEFQISDYTTTTYSVAHTIAGISLTHWSSKQILLVETSTGYTNVGTVSNTLNGIPVDTILQPGKKYELIYLVSKFQAKEVV